MSDALQITRVEAPAWMDGCQTCVDLVVALVDAPTDPIPAPQLESAFAHWVESHRNQLPALQENCPVCADWTSRTYKTLGSMTPVSPDDIQQADRHRAGHLLYRFTD